MDQLKPPTPATLLMSWNVPSPLLRKSTLGP